MHIARENQILMPREAAKWLKISTRTLWTLEKNGQLPSIRFGRSVRYDMADLLAFVVSRKSPSKPVEKLAP